MRTDHLHIHAPIDNIHWLPAMPDHYIPQRACNNNSAILPEGCKTCWPLPLLPVLQCAFRQAGLLLRRLQSFSVHRQKPQQQPQPLPCCLPDIRLHPLHTHWYCPHYLQALRSHLHAPQALTYLLPVWLKAYSCLAIPGITPLSPLLLRSPPLS